MKKLATGAVVFFLAACGSTPGGTDGGSKSCSGDSNCTLTEMCHPVTKQCVKSCMSASECPSTSQKCDIVAGGSTVKTCQCDAANGDNMCLASEVCQPYNLCTSKCSAGSCPTGFSCNSTTGRCDDDNKADAGATCTFGSCTGTGEYCNASNKCEKKTCDASASKQPDSCGYGNFCSGTNCDNAPGPTAACSNIPTSHTSRQWDTTKSGVVMFNGTEVTDDAAFCKTTSVAYSAEFEQYATKDWPSQIDATNGDLTYFDSTTKATAVFMSQRPSSYVPNGKYLKLKVTLCRDGTDTGAITGGFNWTNGNPYCQTYQGGTKGTTN